MMKLFVTCALLISSQFFFAQTYTSYFTGDTSNVNTQTELRVCLMGGATEDDNAMTWFLQGSGGGDIVVIRATGSNGYNSYLYSSLGITVNSVETLVIPSVSAANDPYVRRRLREAEAVFIAGGDQFNYVSYWKNSAVDSALNYLINVKKVPVGGTSAGMAIMGQAYFNAANGSVNSATALSDPYGNTVTIGNNDFIKNPLLRRVITDTHYDNPDRRGRQTTFLARLFQDSSVAFYGIACDEYTAVCIDSNGVAKVFGGFPAYDDNAYFIQPNCVLPNSPENCVSAQALTWNRNNEALKVYAIKGTASGAGNFNLKNWQNPSATGGSWQDWYVVNGVLNVNNGASAISCVTTGFNERSKDEVHFFPNPVQEKLFFTSEISEVIVTDLHGRALLRKDNVNQIDLLLFDDGVYFVTCKKGFQTHCRKIIIQK